MSVSGEPEDNLMSQRLDSPATSQSCAKDSGSKRSYEAQIINYDEVSENPILSFSGNEINLTFKVPAETFLKIAVAAINHFKSGDGDSSHPEIRSTLDTASLDVNGNTNGADVVSNSNSIVNLDLNSPAGLVNSDNNDDSRENKDCQTIELACETSFVENQSSTGESIEDVLETLDIPSERETSGTENNTSDALHTDSIFDETENKTSDLNKSYSSDAAEKESPEFKNVWPEMHGFRIAEAIPITELKSVEIPSASTKYFKAELTDSVIVIKVSGKYEDLYLHAKKYEFITSSDADFQNKVIGQISSSTTEHRLTLQGKDSALKSRISDINSVNLSRPEDICRSEQYFKEKNLGQSFSELSGSFTTSHDLNTSTKSPEPSESTMNNSHNQTFTQTCSIMNKSVDENSQQSESNLLDRSIGSEMKCEKTPCVDVTPKISFFDHSYIPLNSKGSFLETEDEKEKKSKDFEESGNEIVSDSLYELKTLPLSVDVLNRIDDKLLEKTLKASELMHQITKEKFEVECAEKISKESREENEKPDEISFQTRLLVSIPLEYVNVNADTKCNVAVQSKEGSTEKNGNSSETVAVDKEKVCLPKDVAVEENILKESPIRCEKNELNLDGFKSTQTVSGNEIIEVNSDRKEFPDSINSKAIPDVLEGNTPENEIRITEDLSVKNGSTEESNFPKMTCVSLSKSTFGESSIKVEEKESLSTNESSGNTSEVTISEDNIIGTSRNVSLNELNENPANDVLKHHSSPSIQKLKNEKSEVPTVDISESVEAVGETKLVKKSPISEANFQTEISMDDTYLEFSRLSLDEEKDSFSKTAVDASSEKSATESTECHHSISPIPKDIEIKRFINDNDEHDILEETEFTESPKNEIPSTDVSLKDSDECEHEKSKYLPDICSHEEKLRPAGSSSQIHEEKDENDTMTKSYVDESKSASSDICSHDEEKLRPAGSSSQIHEEKDENDTMTKSYVDESDESKSAASESEDCKVSKSSEKTLSDTDEKDSAPTRLRTRKAAGSRYCTSLTADVIPEDDVKNIKSEPVSSTLLASASKSSERVSPITRSLRSKNVDKTPHISKPTESEKKSQGTESRKKRATTPDLAGRRDLKTLARSSPRKLPKKGLSGESEIAESRSSTGKLRNKPLFNVDAAPKAHQKRQSKD